MGCFGFTTLLNARSNAPGVSSASTSFAISRNRWNSAGSSRGRRVWGLRAGIRGCSNSVRMHSNKCTRGNIDRIKRMGLTISVHPCPNGLAVNIIKGILSGHSSEPRTRKEPQHPFFGSRYSVASVPYSRPSPARRHSGSRCGIGLRCRVGERGARKDHHGDE